MNTAYDDPEKRAWSRVKELLEAEKKKGATQTMVRIRPETKLILEQLKRKTGLSYTGLIHVALTLLSDQEGNA